MSITNPAGNARNVDAIIGERVHQLMWRKHITQTALAPMLGIGQTGLSPKLRGKRGWSASDIATLAEFFGVTTDYLFGNDDGVGPAGIEPTTSTVKTWVPQTGHMAEVIDLASRQAA